MSEGSKTPLYENHIKAGGKMVEFAGWLMPVQYQGLRQEHINTRENIGLFDVSHMGEIRVKGPNAVSTLEWVTSNRISKLERGQAHYSLLMNAQGGIVDDLIVYCMEPNSDYLLCVNAANKAKDLKHLLNNNRDALIEDESDLWAQIAVQGPKSFKLLEEIFSPSLRDVKSFHFVEEKFASEKVLIARTGYTGESGVEIFVPPQVASELWEELLKKGERYGVAPVGLGARDTLRVEMKYPLYGNDINDQ
ncbi:MAG: glycine cleavage system aminomethyltransferase GcvT, partial [Bdellovibrionales bacterium]|nr:glycine cleavage system aminomethyltransferase GcvT [Bdellovibrionales bacterium]